MKLYLSGPITGIKVDSFGEAQLFIEKLGHEVVNPTDLNAPGTDWTEAMRVDIKALIYCDGIVMLPNWSASKGAKLEIMIARELGLKVFYLVRINGSLAISLDCKELLLSNIHIVTGVSLELMQSDTTERKISDARKIFAKIARENYRYEWKDIGETICRDHSTAICARKEANNLISSNENFRNKYERVYALTISK